MRPKKLRMREDPELLTLSWLVLFSSSLLSLSLASHSSPLSRSMGPELEDDPDDSRWTGLGLCRRRLLPLDLRGGRAMVTSSAPALAANHACIKFC